MNFNIKNLDLRRSFFNIATTYLIPEFQPGNSQFFAYGGTLTSSVSIVVDGYRLWGFANRMNDFSSPFSIVAVPCAQCISYFYSVTFPNSLPNFEANGLSVVKYNMQNLICMSTDEISKHPDAFPLAKGDWGDIGLKYHALGAFYDLGISYSLSTSVFVNIDHFDSYSRELSESYSIPGSFNMILGRIFADVVYALSFFGYSNPLNSKQEKSLEYAESIARRAITADCNCFFAFGNIRYAIELYHKACYPNRSLKPSQFSPATLRGLLESVKVIASFVSKKFPVDESDFNNSLTKSMRKWQELCGINESYCGQKTIRSLIFNVASHNDNLISTLSGLPPPNRSPPDLHQPLIPGDEIGTLLGQIPSLNQASQILDRKSTQCIGESALMSFIIQERVDKCSDRISAIGKALDSMSRAAVKVEKQIEQADAAIEAVLDDQIHMQEKVAILRDTIDNEMKTNKIVFVSVMVIVAIICYRLIRVIIA